jgi:Phosphomannomutase
MEGAEGAAQIKKLVDSYAANPPTEVDGSKVIAVQNFATDEIYDVEGDRVPPEAMIMITLADARRIAIRPSGTEPKIKYYMFAVKKPADGKPLTGVADLKTRVANSLENLWKWLSNDAQVRLQS